jgi:hypothetical protein
MNKFLQSAIKLVSRHGLTVSYLQVTEGSYDVNTGSVTNSETTTSIKAFPSQVKVSQFNYPNLIGKQVLEFLVAGSSLGSKPSTQDKIIYSSDTYTVDSFSEHSALGQVCLYKIIAVKA